LSKHLSASVAGDFAHMRAAAAVAARFHGGGTFGPTFGLDSQSALAVDAHAARNGFVAHRAGALRAPTLAALIARCHVQLEKRYRNGK
jgi:hypothetical protein